MSRPIRIYALFGDHGLHAGKEVTADDHTIRFARYSLDDYVLRGTHAPFAVKEETFRAVLSEIEQANYDLVYADSREALLVHYALRKRGRASPQFLVQDPDLLQAAEEARRFIFLHYREDPLPDFLASRANHWMIITRARLPAYERMGVPPDRIYHIPMAASSIGFFFPQIERFLIEGCAARAAGSPPPSPLEGEGGGGGGGSTDGFVLSAGTHDRDYETLVRAVDGLPMRLRVICSLRQHRPIPAQNVLWSDSVPEAEYLDAFRQARYVIVPLRPSARAAGQMNCVIPMHMGKTVIASRSEHLHDHVIDGQTGFLFEPGDSASLRKSIQRLESEPENADRMAAHGRRRAETLSAGAREEMDRLLANVKRGATRDP